MGENGGRTRWWSYSPITHSLHFVLLVGTTVYSIFVMVDWLRWAVTVTNTGELRIRVSIQAGLGQDIERFKPGDAHLEDKRVFPLYQLFRLVIVRVDDVHADKTENIALRTISAGDFQWLDSRYESGGNKGTPNKEASVKQVAGAEDGDLWVLQCLKMVIEGSHSNTTVDEIGRALRYLHSISTGKENATLRKAALDALTTRLTKNRLPT